MYDPRFLLHYPNPPHCNYMLYHALACRFFTQNGLARISCQEQSEQRHSLDRLATLSHPIIGPSTFFFFVDMIEESEWSEMW
jgi:hypothetical protein